MPPVRPHPTTGEPIVDDEGNRGAVPVSNPSEPPEPAGTSGGSPGPGHDKPLPTSRDDKPPPTQPGIMN
jgi:hypothetical protein